MIYVIATITLKEGQREKYLRELRKIMPLVHGENGCIEYRPWTDVNTGSRFQAVYRTDTVTILEKWESLDALKNHGASTHMTAFRHDVKEFVQTMALQILSPVE